MVTPLRLFLNTLRSLSISSSILMLSSSSWSSSYPWQGLCSRIRKYISGLLSITRLFSINARSGLTSATPKLRSDTIPSDPKDTTPPLISALVPAVPSPPLNTLKDDPLPRTICAFAGVEGAVLSCCLCLFGLWLGGVLLAEWGLGWLCCWLLLCGCGLLCSCVVAGCGWVCGGWSSFSSFLIFLLTSGSS